MNDFKKYLANDFENTQIPENFIQAINEYNAETEAFEAAAPPITIDFPFPLPRLERQCRCLIFEDNVYESFFGLTSTGEDRYASIAAPGGGWVNWYLCRYQGQLYFVFCGISNKHYSARKTSQREIEELVERGQDRYNGLYQVSSPVQNTNSSSLFDELQGDDCPGSSCYSTPQLPRKRLFPDSPNEASLLELQSDVSFGPPPLLRANSYAHYSSSSDPFTTPQREQGVILFPKISFEDDEDTLSDNEENDSENGEKTELDDEDANMDSEYEEECSSDDESEDDEEASSEDEDDDDDETESDEEDDDDSEYDEEASSEDDKDNSDNGDEDANMDSDDEEVVDQAWDNIIFEPRQRRKTKFYNPEEEKGVPGSGPRGDYYDRNFDPDRYKRHRKN